MANAVVDTNEVFLNGVYYPTTRPIRSTLASIYPAKVVIGTLPRTLTYGHPSLHGLTGVVVLVLTAWKEVIRIEPGIVHASSVTRTI